MSARKTKPFPTLAVVGVYTGRLIQEGGMSAIHEVMDHLFPGIMTIGVAAMLPTASKHIGTTVPGVAELPEFTDATDRRAFAALAVERLGATLDVSGPLKVSESEACDAFDALLGRGR